MSVISLHTEFHILSSKGSLVIAIKLKAQLSWHTVWRSIAIQQFRTLR